jgi:hypothetical protein
LPLPLLLPLPWLWLWLEETAFGALDGEAAGAGFDVGDEPGAGLGAGAGAGAALGVGAGAAAGGEPAVSSTTSLPGWWPLGAGEGEAAPTAPFEPEGPEAVGTVPRPRDGLGADADPSLWPWR